MLNTCLLNEKESVKQLKLVEEMCKRNQVSEIPQNQSKRNFQEVRSGPYFRDLNKLIVIIFHK